MELGSGSSVKTRLLIDVLFKSQKHLQYFPIDISEILDQSAKSLCMDYENLKVTGVVDTYEKGLDFIEHYDDKPNLITFLGSSFGNLDHNEGMKFLQRINTLMKSDDLFLIGLDLKKDHEVLHNAYNDSQKTTAKFNLNVLKRINEETIKEIRNIIKPFKDKETIFLGGLGMITASVILVIHQATLRLQRPNALMIRLLTPALILPWAILVDRLA